MSLVGDDSDGHLAHISRLYRVFVSCVLCQAMTPPEYGLEEFVEGVEALDMPDDVIKVRFCFARGNLQSGFTGRAFFLFGSCSFRGASSPNKSKLKIRFERIFDRLDVCC